MPNATAAPFAWPWRRAWHERLPGRCTICHAWPARTVCDDCTARFASPIPRCRRCALPFSGPGGGDAGDACCDQCLRQPPPLDRVVACCDYTWPWPEHIGRFKFQNEPGLAGPMASLMRNAPWAEPLLDSAQIVLPMPLAPARLRQRGFNQALELARHLAPRSKLDAHMLLRVRETPPQSRLDRQARLANLRGAFAVSPHGAARLKDAQVLLVDDVMTSGASLHAAALALRAAGAAGVGALVFARTEPPPGAD